MFSSNLPNTRKLRRIRARQRKLKVIQIELCASVEKLEASQTKLNEQFLSVAAIIQPIKVSQDTEPILHSWVSSKLALDSSEEAMNSSILALKSSLQASASVNMQVLESSILALNSNMLVVDSSRHALDAHQQNLVFLKQNIVVAKLNPWQCHCDTSNSMASSRSHSDQKRDADVVPSTLEATLIYSIVKNKRLHCRQ